MDERHWWFATKLQETFHVGPYDSPTMLEDFMAEQSTLDYINDFLAPEGHTKLFFYCPKADPNSLLPRKMNVASSCAKLKEVMDGEAICLYFIRSNLERVIDPTCVEKEVFCGEIKENPLVHFSSLLSEIFAPILHAQKDWGHSSEDDVAHFLNQIDKYTNTLAEYANATIAPQQILKKPESQVTSDFKQNRAAAVNPSILQEYENLVMDWIVTIENILTDGLEERYKTSDNVHLAVFWNCSTVCSSLYGWTFIVQWSLSITQCRVPVFAISQSEAVPPWPIRQDFRSSLILENV